MQRWGEVSEQDERRSTAKVRIDKFNPIPLRNGLGVVFLGKDEPAVVFHDEVGIPFAELFDQIGDGAIRRYLLGQAVDRYFNDVFHGCIKWWHKGCSGGCAGYG